MCTNKTKFFKSVSALLLTCLLAVLPSGVMAQTFIVDGISYTVMEGPFWEGMCEVSSNQDRSLNGDISIPETVEYNGVSYMVIGIQQEAFAELEGLTSVTLSNNVMAIGRFAFAGCRSLKNVFFTERLNELGEGAFANCVSLDNLVIPQNIRCIERATFVDCRSLTNISLPESLEIIGETAFMDCSSLKEITCLAVNPPSANDAFTNIKTQNITLRVPDESIHEYMRTEPWSNFNIVQEFTVDGITYTIIEGSTTECVVSYKQDESLSGDITIPETVKCGEISYTVVGIEAQAFENFDALFSVKMPNSVKEIGTRAFADCSFLSDITLPETLKIIEESTFENCSSLINMTLPESLNSIGDAAFYECSSLAEISIPESISSIGTSAFSGCSILKNIILPKSLTSIKNSTFSGCSSLTSITLPESLSSIGNSAFAGCYSLTSITLPASLKSIGELAFYRCSSLKEITCLSLTPPSASSYFESAFETLQTWYITLYVPNESVETYKTTDIWEKFNIVGIDVTGITDVKPENSNPTAIYSLDGKKVSETQKGWIYLHRYGNGKTVKRIAK